jgi:hypothetical protein
MKKLNVLGKLLRLVCVALVMFNGNMVKAQTTTPGIDISKKYPGKIITVQDIAGIEYVPLETTDKVLIDKDKQIISISDNRIVVCNYQRGDIFIFGRDGKVVSNFNHVGGSGEEYTWVQQFIYDEKNRELFVSDIGNKILVYSEDGKFLRSFKTPAKTQLTLYNFDDKTFLAYDEFGMVMGNNYSKTPYSLMSKKDGSVVSTLDMTVPKRYSPSVLSKGRVEGTMVASVVNLNNNWHDGQNLLIADKSSDTVFQLTQDKTFTPLIIRKPSIHNDPPEARIFLTPVIKTDKFIVFEKVTFEINKPRKGDEDVARPKLLYEFADGQISDASFQNADCPPLPVEFIDVNIAKNTGAALIEPFQLLEYLEQGKVKGDLKQLAGKLKDDDNPVVMIIKFKQ